MPPVKPFIIRSQARAEGEVLANDLTNATNAVKVEVLKDELLIAVYTALQQKQPQWVLTDSTETQKLSDQMGVLARIYAALDPQVRPNTPSSTTPDFLTPLWQAQTPVNEHPQPKAVIQQKLDLSVAALADLMTAHPNPRGALQLATNLLQAASEVVYLRESLQDATFVWELMGLAFQYSKYGTLTGTAGSVYGEDLAMALDLLSAPTADGTSRQAQGALGQAFKFLDSTADKLQLVRLVGNLLEAVKQVPALQQVMGSPPSQREILERVIALATSYLSLNPTGTMSAGQPLKFLETLMQPRTEAILSQGAAEFQAFLADTTTYTERRRLLEMEIKTLKAAKQVQLTSDLPALRQQMGDVMFLNALATTSKTYASFSFSPPQAGDAPLNGFLDTLYRAQTPAEISQAGDQLDAFLHDPSNEGVAIFGSDAAKRVKFMDFTTNLLKAAKQVPSLRQPMAQSATLKELVELGRAYASLDPVAEEAPSQDPQLFLNTLWQTQNLQKGAGELEAFLEDLNPTYRLTLLQFEQEMLAEFKLIPVQGKLRDSGFLKDLVVMAKDFVHVQLSDDLTEMLIEPSGFLDEVWGSSWNQEVLTPASSLQTFFVRYAQKPDPESNIDGDPDTYPNPGPPVALLPLAIPVAIITIEGIKIVTVTVAVTAGVLLIKWYNDYGQQIVRSAGNVIGQTTEQILNRAKNLIRELFSKTNDEGEDRNPKDDQKLSKREAEALKKGGEDPEVLKDYQAGKDLFKDKRGRIYVKPKDGSGPGEPTGLNIRDFRKYL